MTLKIGLTGSIGMGKSTTSKIFKDLGCDVWDADAAVHRLYEQGGAAVTPIQNLWPQAIFGGAVSRDRLKDIIAKESDALAKLEKIVHPLVRQDRAEFATHSKADCIVFDIPLLFETNSEGEFDAVVCVDVNPILQRERVMARGTMTEAQFEQILSKQMPNDEKVRRSDFRVRTDTLELAENDVKTVLETLKSGSDNA